MADKKRLLDNLDKIHTTEMGIDRIKRNLNIDSADVVEYCKRKVREKIAIYTNWGRIGIVRWNISKLPSIHIAIPSSQHILFRNVPSQWRHRAGNPKRGFLHISFYFLVENSPQAEGFALLHAWGLFGEILVQTVSGDIVFRFHIRN